jgi:hypothetical protein
MLKALESKDCKSLQSITIKLPEAKVFIMLSPLAKTLSILA